MDSLFNRKNFLTILLFLAVTFPSLASPEWMKKTADEKKLSELCILGTHNSCALQGGDYAQCQSLNLRAQLDLGVRFLDVRCRAKQGEFHIYHGIADQKMKFSEVRDICEKFLRDHPSETIMMSIKDEGSKHLKEGEFGGILTQSLLKHEQQWYQKKTIPTLREARGKVVVVSRNREVKGIPWRVFLIQDSFWINRKNTLPNKWQKIRKHFQMIKTNDRASINFISCTGIFNPPIHTAKFLNPKLINALKKKEFQREGIILVDFVTKEMFLALKSNQPDQ